MNDGTRPAHWVKLAGMYENKSARTGDVYFVGYLGASKVLLLRDHKAEQGQPSWSLCITPRREKKKDA